MGAGRICHAGLDLNGSGASAGLNLADGTLQKDTEFLVVAPTARKRD